MKKKIATTNFSNDCSLTLATNEVASTICTSASASASASSLEKTTPTGIVKKNLGFSNNGNNDDVNDIRNTFGGLGNTSGSNNMMGYGDDDVTNEIRAREELVSFLSKRGLLGLYFEEKVCIFQKCVTTCVNVRNKIGLSCAKLSTVMLQGVF